MPKLTQTFTNFQDKHNSVRADAPKGDLGVPMTSIYVTKAALEAAKIGKFSKIKVTLEFVA